MSVDLTIILDHGLTWEELYGLPAALSAVQQPVSEHIMPRNEHSRIPRDWRWKLSRGYSNAAEELFDRGETGLDGPFGFFGTMYKPALELNCFARWQGFLCHRDIQRSVHESVSRIADVLKATTIIYVPDSCHESSIGIDILYEHTAGHGVPVVVEWLRDNVGPPMSSLRVMEETNGPDSAWYFVLHRNAAR